MGEAIVIIGAGHAAGELAISLRQNGYAGRVVMVGEEHHLPYQRPPLSKAYLAGEVARESLYLKPQASYDKAGVELICGTRVEAIERSRKAVIFSNGDALLYDKLALTTGGRVRRLGVPDGPRAEQMSNYHYLRTIDDVSRLRTQFERGLRLVVIGGGYIGLEVAAVAKKHGLHVTVLEALPRVLARVTAPEISSFYQTVHRQAGVDVRTGVEVKGFEFDASRNALNAVVCRDHNRGGDLLVPADLVIVGIGIHPNVELAQAAGLAVDNGIVVDEFTRTADHEIVAAGDCTNHPNEILGRCIRLESVPNAVEQARAAAATLCSKERPYRAVPWFWSDQYDLKLQMVGLSEGYDQLVLRGSPEKRSFAAFYLKEECVIAVDAVNRAKEFMVGKRLVAERKPAVPAKLRDEAIDVKTLLDRANA
jgi:3-phenylpropionate/trans-cinnamate dioxygenase ferredoxin reductase component